MTRVTSEVVQIHQGEKPSRPKIRPRVRILESNRAPALAIHLIIALSTLFFTEDQVPETCQDCLMRLALFIVFVQ